MYVYTYSGEISMEKKKEEKPTEVAYEFRAFWAHLNF